MGSIVRKKRNIYGSEFDSLRYLARFFDLTYRFRQPSRAALVAQLMEDMPIEPAKLNTPYGEEPQAHLTKFVDAMQMEPRGIERL